MKCVRMEDYLKRIGHTPSKVQGDTLSYKSPFQNEHIPSFIVDNRDNTWYDYRINIGGDIFSFVILYYGLDNIRDIRSRIERDLHMGTIKCGPYQNLHPWDYRIETLKFEEELDNDMRDYLKAKHIVDPVIQNLCSAVQCHVLGKDYRAIGFRDSSGGFGVCNVIFHGHTHPGAMTLVRDEEKPSQACCVFNSFMDYLSFLSLDPSSAVHQFLEHSDYLLLDSQHITDGAIGVLEKYRTVLCCFSNDVFGKTMVQDLSKSYVGKIAKVDDLSYHYFGFRTLNEYLCNYQTKKMSCKQKIKIR